MIAGSDAVYSNDFKVQILIHFQKKFHLNNKLFWHTKVLLMYLTMLPTEVIILKKLPINSAENAWKLFLKSKILVVL